MGGNIGDVPRNFARAAARLVKEGFSTLAYSSLYRNPAMGCAPGTPDFVNAALTGTWSGTPRELMALCKRIEVEAGRPTEHPHWSSRTLDVDLILFGDQIVDEPDLKIPHPATPARLFVLVPLAEIAPDWLFPTLGITVKDTLAGIHGAPLPSFKIVQTGNSFMKNSLDADTLKTI